MAIPLPNLDTRTWKDLVEEGRAQIPVAASGWTDHNVHDPGISLMELMAWVVEASIYTCNTVPDRHLRKFLDLAGFPAEAPVAARARISVTPPPATPSVSLPRGTLLRRAEDEGPVLRTASAISPVTAKLVSSYSFDGDRFDDVSDQVRDGQPFLALGPDPAVLRARPDQPALYLGFDEPLPVGREVRLYLDVQGGGRGDELARLRSETEAAADECDSPIGWDCGPVPMGPTTGSASTTPSPAHHGASVVWEWFSSSGWQSIASAAGLVDDRTRALSLGGWVMLTLPGQMSGQRLPEDLVDRYYVRCRLATGRPDVAPLVGAVVWNAVDAVQATPATDRIPIAPGTAAPASLPVGGRVSLAVRLDRTGTAYELAFGVPDAPEALILGYLAPTPVDAGFLESTLVRVATLDGVPGQTGTGRPDQQARLSGAPLVRPTARLWSVAGAGTLDVSEWRLRSDLDAATAFHRWAELDPTSGDLRFGDGVRGAVPPEGDTLLAIYDTTRADLGNVRESTGWEVDDGPYNSAVAGAVLPTAATWAMSNPEPVSGGSAAESASAAAIRAARMLWAHERLVEVAKRAGSESLDQIASTAIEECRAPARAVTALDFERVALDTPGTSIRRARAWAGMDPRLGCLEAPGTVTVVVVPELPVGRPTPTAGLIELVREYLYRRKSIGTRLHVTGPVYTDLAVHIVVRALAGTDPAVVQTNTAHDIQRFLDPLYGGDRGLGWPLGRDVHVPELLAVADGATGVDYVEALQLFADGVDESCGRVCVAPTGLVSVSDVRVEVTGR